MAWLAATPILVAFVMLALRQSSVRTGVVALAVAALLALTAFRPDPTGLLTSGLPFGARIVEVLGILLGGIWLSRVLAVSGAQQLLAGWIERQATGQYAGVLLTVFAITPLAESLTGFGIGVVIAIPILLHLGFDPVRAAVLALLGLNCVTWGGLAPGAAVASSLAGLSLQDLGVRSAQLNIVVLLIVAAVLVPVTSQTSVGTARRGTEALAAVVLLWAAVLGANLVLGTPLAGVVGALVATMVQLALRSRSRSTMAVCRGPLTLARATTPYAFLLVLLIVLRGGVGLLVGDDPPPALRVLESPATCLLLACGFAHAVLGRFIDDDLSIVTTSLRQWYTVGAATGMFMALGWAYTVTGMSQEIGVAVGGLSWGFLLLSPLLGAIGGFMTGSATGSNAMLTATRHKARSERAPRC